MKNRYYSEEELVILSCYAGSTKDETISNLKAALEEQKKEKLPDEEIICVLEDMLDGIQSLEREEFRELLLLFSPSWDEEDIEK